MGFESFFFFALGTAIGSFTNVLTLRYHSGRSLAGRSACFSCGKVIPWYDLVPVVSFFALRGRCRFCKTRLSRQYPIVEIISGAMFLALFLKLNLEPTTNNLQPLQSFLLLTSHFFSFSLLLAIAVYDLRHKIIPDALVIAFAVTGFIGAFLGGFDEPVLGRVLAGPLLSLPFLLLWVVSRGRLIGLGDAKLAVGIGWLLGLSGGLSAIVLGVWIGAATALVLMGMGRVARAWKLPRRGLFSAGTRLTMKSEIPLGPFLILGAAAVFFTGLSPLSLFMFMW